MKSASYFGIKVLPLAYQDDIGDICFDTNMIREHAKIFKLLFDDKKIEAHSDKTCKTILGNRKYVEKI